MTFEEFAALPPDPRLLLDQLNELTVHHRARCPAYDRLVALLYGSGEASCIEEVPYIPAGLFKSHKLASVPDSEIFKVLTSSGTTGQQPSRVYLDRETARRQTLALARVMTGVLGPRRLPMILVEPAAAMAGRSQFNARAAGVLGMISFGSNHFYALNGELDLDREGLRRFLDRFGTEPFLIFGFTFLVWQKLLDSGADLTNAILIHGGGWKQLERESVSREEFRRRFREAAGLTRIHNFYGMVEQAGGIFLEGEDGYFHAPSFGGVLIRDTNTFEALPPGRTGLIQVLSAVPRSYPGHSVLTEDLGVMQENQSFSVIGRIPRSELRGCSDVIAARMS